MEKLWVIGHYGSGDHGNEAIVRGLHKLLKQKFILTTYTKATDVQAGLDQLFEIVELKRTLKKWSFINILGAAQRRLCKKDTIRMRKEYKNFLDRIEPGDVFLFEAGDQCFETEAVIEEYMSLFTIIKERRGKLFMLCGSVPENSIPKLSKFLQMFDFLTVRESLSYNALVKHGFTNSDMIPCVAFKMPYNPEVPSLDGTYIGIDIGLLIQKKEQYNDRLYQAVLQLSQHILDTTDYRILLTPHVNVSEKHSDIIMQQRLQQALHSDRVVRLNEMSADSIKAYIRQCDFFITVRTHTSIAAYSLGIPTLVIGYSQKSRGIAQDIWGSTDLLMELADLNAEELIRKTDKMIAHKDEIHEYLVQRMPDYLKPHENLEKLIEKI